MNLLLMNISSTKPANYRGGQLGVLGEGKEGGAQGRCLYRYVCGKRN